MEVIEAIVWRLAVVALAMLVSRFALSQEYPIRPIRLVVPFAAGGATDLLARELGRQLTERWNQQVVVDSRPGAGGIIGLEIGARAVPGGYTLVMCSSSTLVMGPALGTRLPYDPIKSFTLVTEAADIPVVLVAHPSFPARSITEMIQVAKSKPGQFAYASNGAGTTTHIAGELLKRVAGIDIIHVPYKGGGATINDAIGGQVPLLFGAVSTPLPHIKAGRLRALGVTTPKRLRELPEVPAFAETLQGFEVRQWFGVCGPAGIPRPIVAKLSRDLTGVIGTLAVNERIVRAGLEPISSTPEKFSAYVRDELLRWTRLLKEMGIQAE